MRYRLLVHLSNNHVYAQIIDDLNNRTVLSVSTLTPQVKSKLSITCNKKAAELVGEYVAQQALNFGIRNVVFDRGRKLYHGKVEVLANSARSFGLKF
uniref:ribosomal protein L18 n=1 Tax=Cyanidium caldarium TaxID=2771 RepID=UPI000008CB36|nr:ribosomal protein L18 [Cyanidium caldarium]AAF12922.1 unknown [Cyanidium caldarium]WDB00297.1 ribosomal protein L18 [Cyanidium caldarium]